MATQKQIDANRKNALRSTGPKSARGKLMSSRNGTVHGLRSQDPVLPVIESFEDWEVHLQTFVTSLRAEGSVELLLAHKAAAAIWKQARTESFQTDLAAQQMEAGIAEFEADCPLPEVDAEECPDLTARLWKYENDFAHVPEVQALFDHAFRSAMPRDRQADLLLKYHKAFESEFFRSYNLLVKIRDTRESAEGKAPNPLRNKRQRARVDHIKARLTTERVERILLSRGAPDEDTRIAIEEWNSEQSVKMHPSAEPCADQKPSPPAPAAAATETPQAPAAPRNANPAKAELGSLGKPMQNSCDQTTYDEPVAVRASAQAAPSAGPRQTTRDAHQAELGSVGKPTQKALLTSTCDNSVGLAQTASAEAVDARGALRDELRMILGDKSNDVRSRLALVEQKIAEAAIASLDPFRPAVSEPEGSISGDSQSSAERRSSSVSFGPEELALIARDPGMPCTR